MVAARVIGYASVLTCFKGITMRSVLRILVLVMGIWMGNAEGGVTLPNVSVVCDHLDSVNGPVEVWIQSYGSGTKIGVYRVRDHQAVYHRESDDILGAAKTGTIRFWSPSANAWYTYVIRYMQGGRLMNQVYIGGTYAFSMSCR